MGRFLAGAEPEGRQFSLQKLQKYRKKFTHVQQVLIKCLLWPSAAVTRGTTRAVAFLESRAKQERKMC